MAAPVQPRRRRDWTLALAAVLLAAGSAASLWAWRATSQELARDADAEFDRFAELTVSNIAQRVQHQLDVLAGFGGLFRASGQVSRSEFHAYFEQLRVRTRFPGIQAVQYAQLVGEAQRPAFEAAVRADRSLQPEGYPQYAIHPPGPRPQYMAVVYNEPMLGNEGAFGHDHAAEAQRREVMERARDSGEPQASPPLRLLQQRPGVVVRLPVYRPGLPLDTVAQRRAAHLGQISGVLLADDLLRETLPSQRQVPYQVAVLDRGLVDPPEHAALPAVAQVVRSQHDALSASQAPPAATADRREHTLAVAGRTWTIEVSRPQVEHALAPLPMSLLLGGLTISLLLSGWVARLGWLNERARRLALALSAQARASADRLAAVINSTVEGLVTIDQRGRILSVNRAAQQMFGHPAEALVGRSVGLLMPPEDAARHDGWLARRTPGAGTSLIGRSRQLQGRRVDGTLFPVEITVTEMRIDGERQFVALLRDQTAALAAQARIAETARALQAANGLREAVFQNAAFALIVTDAQRVIQAMNPAAERLLATRAGDEVGRRTLDSLHDEADRTLLLQALQEPLAAPPGEAPRAVERPLRYQRRDGSGVPVSVTLSALHDAEGQLSGYLSISYDITERQRLAEQMARLAYHDGLTGLPNRLRLEDRLQHAIAVARRTRAPLALLFLDLDRFKPINDQHGHAVGDQVLCEVARRLQAVLRAADTVARIGGDEFVVLLSTLARPEDAAVVADKLLGALSAPIALGGLALQVGASVGVARWPADGEDAAALLQAADAAMYAAKQAGRQTLRLAAPAPGDAPRT